MSQSISDQHCRKLRKVLIVFLCMMSATIGCRRKAVVQRTRVTVAPTASKTSPFDMAMEFLNNLDQYEPDVVRLQIRDKLRDWAQEEAADAAWIADPMFYRLPNDVKERFSPESLSTKTFTDFDVVELCESVWLRDVAHVVAKKPLFEPRIESWIESEVKAGTLSRDDSADLSLAYRLFDWVICNVQLDEELDPVDFGSQAAIDQRTPSTLRRQLSAWETLLYGHGDFEERSRLFGLLCRQLGINTVMLIADRGDDQVRQPWVNGVLLGQELYLFDAKLGIPLPGQGRAPFARLTDYVAHPEWLNQLTVASSRYRVVASDLNKLVAAIDATPVALSQRMKQIESRLQGNSRIVLTAAPTPLAKQLRTCEHITNVEIWPFPYRAYQFFDRYRNDPGMAPDLAAQMQIDRQPFSTRSNILRGRLLQLRGFDRGDFDTPGAKKLYMDARMSKRELARIQAIPMDELPEDSPWLQGLPRDPTDRRIAFASRLESMRVNSKRYKDMATYWLGTISMTNQEFKVASDFFKLNVEDPDSRWRQSSRYNLARAYEALGIQNRDQELTRLAIELYAEDETSPQVAGNLLRAQRLQTSLP